MNAQEIKVFCIAKTALEMPQVRKWLKDLGATEFEVPNSDIASEAETLVGLAAKRCYNSFEVGLNPNVTKVRQDWAEFLDNILKQAHGSCLEHATWTFAIEGCTRVFTAEMNRHRAGVAISEASLRYIRMAEGEGIPFWVPLAIRDNPADSAVIANRKSATRAQFTNVLHVIKDTYDHLLRLWQVDTLPFSEKKKITSLLRRILPLGISVGAVYTINARALRHIIAMRATPEAEEEICYVMSNIAQQMFSQEPLLFGDFEQTAEGYWIPRYRKV